MKKTIKIIIPAYNEEKRIENTLKRYLDFFNRRLEKKELEDFEIIVVINNSTDKTEEIVKKYSEENSTISYLNYKRGGKGFAIIEGFKKAIKEDVELVGFVDADMATSPEAFYNLIINVADSDGIIASRYTKGAVVSPKQSIQRIIASRIFNLLIKSLFIMGYKDTQCGAKIFKRTAILKIIDRLIITKWAFDVDLLYQLKKNKFKIKEFPTIWSDKEYSKINFLKSGPLMVLAAIRLRILNSPLSRLVKVYDKMSDNIKKAKRKIVKISERNLKKMKTLNFREVGDYCHKNSLIKWLFWKRLQTMLKMSQNKKNVERVLDFGAGSGIFMPTLSKNFPEVYSLDLEVSSLEYVKKLYGFENVNILVGKEGKFTLPFEDNFFDIIFAADVLEHFKDSYGIQKEFKRVLKKGGYLIISGPTENLLYRLVRKYVYRQKKPEDHYTDVYQVMDNTSKFLKIEKKKTLPFPIMPGFKIYRAKKI